MPGQNERAGSIPGTASVTPQLLLDLRHNKLAPDPARQGGVLIVQPHADTECSGSRVVNPVYHLYFGKKPPANRRFGFHGQRLPNVKLPVQPDRQEGRYKQRIKHREAHQRCVRVSQFARRDVKFGHDAAYRGMNGALCQLRLHTVAFERSPNPVLLGPLKLFLSGHLFGEQLIIGVLWNEFLVDQLGHSFLLGIQQVEPSACRLDCRCIFRGPLSESERRALGFGVLSNKQVARLYPLSMRDRHLGHTPGHFNGDVNLLRDADQARKSS